jgi:hypothetical protein
MRSKLGVVVAMCCLGCGAGALREGYFVKGGLRYRVQGPGDGWRAVRLNDTDLAWTAIGGPQVLSMNSGCDEHGDPSLEVLTGHLLFGFTDREVLEQKPVLLDGREGMRTRARAKLDGVEVELGFTVLKKNGCVYDVQYVTPQGRYDERAADYEKLVSGFSVGALP